ncbi:TonB-dependent receptor domain-containing protein [Paraglaciecola sp. 2405UD69-4]|uniref:TonB-dependent receptor domain-containing protein n=1 Tax=Paraglaciecola sp. 2405UD69-4 TaxID=3391836 RepID=UPI0039C90A23
MKLTSTKMRYSAIALSVVASLTSVQALSQEESDSEASVENVTVWGTEVKTSSLFLKQQAIADKQADHISDLLRVIPGIDVGGAHSLNQRITIRSMDDKDLQISIDGARQNSYMYHHLGNLQIHADILQSVDINVGTNSVINGGIGGAVRFETKQAADLLDKGQEFGARVQVGAGDNSGTTLSATAYGMLSDNADFLVYHNAVNRDNYEVGGGKILNSSGEVIDGTDGTVRGLEGELRDTLIKFGYNLNDNQRFEIGYESYKDEGDYSYRPDMGLATDLAITNSLGIPLLWPTELTRDTLTLNYDLTIDNTVIKAAVYKNTSELKRDESGWADNAAFAGNAGFITGEASNTGASLIANTIIDSSIEHGLTYGFDYVKHDTHYQGEFTDSTATSGEDSSTLALFIEDKISLNEQFSVIPGLRYENYEIDSAVVDDEFDALNLALALEYAPSNDLLFRFSATEIFKGPEISEVFIGAGLYDTANADIKEETGLNLELSFAYQTEIDKNQSIALGATLFKTEVNDYIYDYATAPEEIGGSWKDNVGDMSIDGFEAYFEYSYKAFTTLFTVSRAESELSAFADYTELQNARLDRQQGDTFTLNLNYTFSDANIVTSWEIQSVQDVDAGVDLDGATLDNSKDGFVVHNMSARWTPDAVKGLTLVFGIDNVFDEFYASQSSRTGVSFHPLFGELYLQDFEPGRNIKATVQYKF